MKIKQQDCNIVTIGSKADRVTIGYRKVNRMVQVAVSYCAPDDKWKAKTGRVIVLERLKYLMNMDANIGVISLPMGQWDHERIQSVLMEMFCDFPQGE